MKKTGEPTQIWYESKLQGLADVIDRQYVLRIQHPEIVAQISFANTIPMVNAVKPTLELWHQRMGHLSYRKLLRLPQLANGIDVKGPVPENICGPRTQGRQRRKFRSSVYTKNNKGLRLDAREKERDKHVADTPTLPLR